MTTTCACFSSTHSLIGTTYFRHCKILLLLSTAELR